MRQVKTAAQRAAEHLAVLERRAAKLRTAKAKLEEQARGLDPEIAAVQARIDHAKADPDLCIDLVCISCQGTGLESEAEDALPCADCDGSGYTPAPRPDITAEAGDGA